MNTKEISLAVFVNAKSKAVVGGGGDNSERILTRAQLFERRLALTRG